MFCKNCGKEINGGRTFCSNCGVELSKKKQSDFSITTAKNENLEQNQFSWNQTDNNTSSTKNKKILLFVCIILLCTGCLVGVLGMKKEEPSFFATWKCDNLSILTEVLEYVLVDYGASVGTADYIVNDILGIDVVEEITFTFKSDGHILLGINGVRVGTDWLTYEYTEDNMILKLNIIIKGKTIITTEYETTYTVTKDKLIIDDFFGEHISFTKMK